MTVIRCVVVAAVSLMLTACGDDGKYYRLAIDTAPLGSLPGSCFVNGQAPDTGDSTENLFTQATVLEWESTDGAQYLDVGNFGSIDMGDAPTVRISGLIKGSKNTFTGAEITDQGNGRSDRAELTFAFAEMGENAKGTITVKSTVTCSGCGVPSCEATMNFQGRRFDPDELTITGVN